MMSNPHEYRDNLWSLIVDGEVTEEMKQRAKENEVQRAKAAIGKATPKSALSEMEELMQAAERLRTEPEA